MTISSRTSGIINRLPHFFQSEDPASKLYQLVSVFASQIDQAEEDLLGIMRTHWINTADDDVSPTAGSNAKATLIRSLTCLFRILAERPCSGRYSPLPTRPAKRPTTGIGKG